MSVPENGIKMSNVAFLDRARGWAKTLEDLEAKRSERSVDDARPTVARRIGIAAGTLFNLRRNRVKDVKPGVYERLRGWVIRELEAEKAAIEHEILLARQQGLDPRDDQMAQATADLALVRKALGLEPAD